jgi:hypothetical protein
MILSYVETSLQDNEDQKDHEKEDNKDNRALIDNNTAQNLSSEEILQMRRFLFACVMVSPLCPNIY